VNDRTRNKLFGLGALLVAGAALAWISMSDLGDDLVYYWSPTELVQAANAREATVRLGGMVQPGSVQWNKDAQTIDFLISDGTQTVRVHSDGNPPQMFREGIGVVVEGRLGADDIFRTERVMVKHNNEYQAPEAGEKPSAATMTEVGT